MTLGFSTQINGKPSYFIEKIWESLPKDLIKRDYELSLACYKQQFGKFWHVSPTEIKPKKHTMREDKNDRWKAGNDIHMVINNRTNNRFQFAPTIKCVSTQEVRISY